MRVLFRSLQEVERTGTFVEIDVRRQHPRLEIGRDWIEVIGGRERPTCLATAEEAMVAQMIVDIGNEHVEGDAPIEGISVRLPLRAMLRGGSDDLRVSLPSLRSARLPGPGGVCGFGLCCLRTSDWTFLKTIGRASV